ncbi:MAG: S-layer homology domain-containing protein [Clostridiales bacterium]|nr:S-layer homology domain-containing protein [Clostridiales bacterium]
MIKKISLLIFLAALMTGLVFIPASVANYTLSSTAAILYDKPILNASYWAKEELLKAYDMGLIPDSLSESDLSLPISRVELAAITVAIYESLTGTKTATAASNPFSDTSDINAQKAFNAGLMAGITVDKFNPDAFISREQAAFALTCVLMRTYISDWTFATANDYSLIFTMPAKFADDAQISEWAKPSVYFMAAHGIVNGTGNHCFSPRALTPDEITSNYAVATREQAIIISLRMLENLGGKQVDYHEGNTTKQMAVDDCYT